MRDYLAATMTSVMVSIDGPAAVQDRLRPRAGGGPSSAAVERTLDAPLRRATVTSAPASRARPRRSITPPRPSDTSSTTYRSTPSTSSRSSSAAAPSAAVCGRRTRSASSRSFRECREYAARHGRRAWPTPARGSRRCAVLLPGQHAQLQRHHRGRRHRLLRGHRPRRSARRDVHLRLLRPPTAGRSSSTQRASPPCAGSPSTTRRAARAASPSTTAPGDCPSKRLYSGADDAVVARCEINRRLTLDQLEEVREGPRHAAGSERSGLRYAASARSGHGRSGVPSARRRTARPAKQAAAATTAATSRPSSRSTRATRPSSGPYDRAGESAPDDTLRAAPDVERGARGAALERAAARLRLSAIPRSSSRPRIPRARSPGRRRPQEDHEGRQGRRAPTRPRPGSPGTTPSAAPSAPAISSAPATWCAPAKSVATCSCVSDSGGGGGTHLRRRLHAARACRRCTACDRLLLPGAAAD